MRAHIAILTLLFVLSTAKAQILTLDHGKIAFHTSSIMSDIEAESSKIEVSLDIQSRIVEIRMAIASFEFEYEMMQEHFNEEYLESELYPDATFVGKIFQDISDIQEAIEVDISGVMTIHGVSKPISFQAILANKEGFVKAKCAFPIIFKDFNIDEPSILATSVAKDVEVKGVLYLK